MQTKTLFSRHYLEHRLPDHPEWSEDPRPACEAVRALWEKARQHGDSWNEAQTEDEFVRPVLEALGWSFIVQPKSHAGGRVTRPDYALFADDAARDAAYSHQGDDDPFYSRALAIAEAKYWGRPLSQKDASGRNTWKAESNPSHQMVSYLVGTRVPWGILTDGPIWRLYSREVSSTASEYYEIDLTDIFAPSPATDHAPRNTQHETRTTQLTAFKHFWLFFRRDAFTPDAQGKSFIQRVHEGSATYARQISDKLKELVFDLVMPEIAGGFVAYRAGQLGVREETDESLREIYQASLSLLYKLLFLLYAEARALLPVANPGYREQSLTALAQWAAERLDKGLPLSDATHATPRYDALLALFHRIDQGDPSLSIPRYNGGLFNPASPENQFLERHKLSDRTVARAVDILVRDAGQPVDYAYVGVRNLGAIYEGLLENRLVLVERPDRSSETCQVCLVNDKGERKASGSYYTPDYIVEYIVGHTLDPLLAERDGAFRAAMERCASLRRKLARTSDSTAVRQLRDQLDRAERDAREAFLGLKVLDPAMGSGHFLVNAVDHLTDSIIQRLQAYHDEHPRVPWAWNPIQQLIERVRGEILAEMERQGIGMDPARLDDTAILTRLVMKRCIYGVDLNRMAVELAKVSLWLHSFTVGAPLSFLDHHLRWGNSLIGTDVRTVERAVQMTETGQMGLFAGPFAGLLDLTGLMTEVVERSDTTLADVRQSAEDFERFQRELTSYKQVLDLWVSQYFGNDAATEFLTLYGADVLPALRGERQVAERYGEAIRRARELWGEKRFFHWDLEFPEVFVDLARRDWAENPGFDAVVGNPPYVRVRTLKEIGDPNVGYYESGIFYCAKHVWDIYMLFAEQAQRLARTGGACSFIMPIQTLHQPNALALRDLLLDKCWVREIVDLSNLRVFEEALVKTCILVYSPISDRTAESVSLRIPPDPDLELAPTTSIAYSTLMQSPGHSFKPDLLTTKGLLDKIVACSIPLGDMFYVTFGLRSCAPGKGQGGKDRLILATRSTQNARPYMEGREIGRFETDWAGRYIDYVPDQMYSPRTPALFEQPKLVAQSMLSKKRLVATFDPDHKYVEQSLVCIVPRDTLPQHEEYPSLLYVLALINSALSSYYFARLIIGDSLGGGLIHATPGSQSQLPICRIAFTTPPDERARLVGEGSQRINGWATDKRMADAWYSSFLASPFGRWLDARLSPTQHATRNTEHETRTTQSDVVHDLLAHLAQQMIEMNKRKQAEVKGFLAWLAREIGAPVDGLTGKSRLQNYLGDYQKGEAHLALNELLDILRRNRRHLRADPSARTFQERLAQEYEASLEKLLPLKARLSATDRLIDLIVYRLYGLTEEEVAVVEERR